MQNSFAEQTQITVSDVFSLDQTFSCGQCFRWERLAKECWRGTAFGRKLTLCLDGDILRASCPCEEFDALWRSYLDLDSDYAAMRRCISVDSYTARCAQYGAGIRILRQDPWETLVSFILSQCSNIPRIKQNITRLCSAFGEKIDENVFSFPGPDQIAGLSENELDILRCGYRAPYILAAARAVSSGLLDLEKLAELETGQLREKLLSLPGVGIKVASCVMLFGYHRLDAFPVDTWMRKALRTHYEPDFDPKAAFGEYAGLAQQYLFFSERENSARKVV